jgi:ribosomal protein L22
MTMNQLLNRMTCLTIRGSNQMKNCSFKLNSSSASASASASSIHTSSSINGNYNNKSLLIGNHLSIIPQFNANARINMNAIRHKSTSASAAASASNISEDGTIIATGPDGTQYSIPLKPLGPYQKHRYAPKLPPHIVTKRISKLRIMPGAAKNIRHSPWRLNLICQFVATQTVNDALRELPFVEKVKAPLVEKLIQGTANSAFTKHGLLKSQLEVVECFATQGSHLKRVKRMGRGRSGKMARRFAHIRIVLREIDFPLKIMQCTSVNQRRKWIKKMEVALKEVKEYDEEREEIEGLEREVAEMKKKKELDEK